MRVAFDEQVFLLQEYGGISRYLCSLVRQLSSNSALQARIFAPLHFNHNLDDLDNPLCSGRRIPSLPPKFARLVMIASKALARREIVRFKPDILHQTYFSEDNFQPNLARRVLTIYDLIHERYPNSFINSAGTTRPKRIAANRADHVICISESTRRDLVEYCGVPEERTSVIYLGVDPNFGQVITTTERLNPRPFLLYVGARGGYKNFDGLVKAFAKSERLRREFDLLCFGGGAISSSELELAMALGLRPNQLIQIGGSDNILVSLYKQASALVYPSLYEGFGIPPLEAMTAGCPVICSNSSSLPEVVGDAAETFNPLDMEAILAALENVLDSPERQKALIAAGWTRCRQFTWEKCAHETEALYRSLL